MRFRFLSVALAAASLCCASERPVLRVCADPNNLPFSNDRGEGFENKLAELIAGKLNERLEYTWWSERKSFIKNSLNQNRCDALMGVPAELDSVEVTRPYYESSYVFVSRHDRNLKIATLADPRLRDWRIGIQVVGDDFAPPAFALARRGITRNVVGFSLFGRYGEPNPPRAIIDAVERGTVDLAVVWGPFAGYFAKSSSIPLDIVPVSPPIYLGVPFTYRISIGVRKGDDELRARLDRVLASEGRTIQRMLADYGVPGAH
jgi:quinoprotein dehydrogenase-associated probable ABC transporter substrate-binding protein